MIFPYEKYRQFLTHVKDIGEIVRMCDTKYQAGEIVLRHDVDLDILPAYEMSQVEMEQNVRSTYFILTTCHSYNPGSPNNRAMLKKMAADGFEIGLHFDPSLYGDIDPAEMQRMADHEALNLQIITGQAVQSVSIHTPSIHGQYPSFQNYRNAYDTRIFSDEVYMSDSRMDFRGKQPFEFVNEAKERAIQILLHPMHFTKDGVPYPYMYLDYIKNHVNTIDEEHSRVNSGYAAQKTKPLLDYLTNQNQDDSK